MTLSTEASIQFSVGDLKLTPTEKVELSIRLKQNREIIGVDFEEGVIIITPRFELLHAQKGVSNEVKAHSLCNERLAQALTSMQGIRV